MKINKKQQHKELINIYKRDFEKIQEFVNEFDPCGFIKIGAPINEYDCLTKQLLSLIYKNCTKNDLRNLVINEITHHFEEPDLEILKEPYKSKFYKNLDLLIDNLEELKKNMKFVQDK